MHGQYEKGCWATSVIRLLCMLRHVVVLHFLTGDFSPDQGQTCSTCTGQTERFQLLADRAGAGGLGLLKERSRLLGRAIDIAADSPDSVGHSLDRLRLDTRNRLMESVDKGHRRLAD